VSAAWTDRVGGTVEATSRVDVAKAAIRGHPCVVGRARLVIVVAFFLLTGCRSFPAPEAAGSIPALAQEAPEACGFPDGTALSYAGRSTTAALDVQEVVGDPMSDDPADIYITRDAFDQGDLHGRLVCAIFVNEPDFVEVTVHPDDGGRISVEEPEPSFAPEPSDGISRDDAVDAARDVVPEAAEWDVIAVEAGPVGQFEYLVSQPFISEVPADRWVWVIDLGHGPSLGAEGSWVVIDYLDGRVYGVIDWIS
jgi:hypothetical protein